MLLNDLVSAAKIITVIENIAHFVNMFYSIQNSISVLQQVGEQFRRRYDSYNLVARETRFS